MRDSHALRPTTKRIQLPSLLPSSGEVSGSRNDMRGGAEGAVSSAASVSRPFAAVDSDNSDTTSKFLPLPYPRTGRDHGGEVFPLHHDGPRIRPRTYDYTPRTTRPAPALDRGRRSFIQSRLARRRERMQSNGRFHSQEEQYIAMACAAQRVWRACVRPSHPLRLDPSHPIVTGPL